MAPPYQISDWYGGRHTCYTASGATGSKFIGKDRAKRKIITRQRKSNSTNIELSMTLYVELGIHTVQTERQMTTYDAYRGHCLQCHIIIAIHHITILLKVPSALNLQPSLAGEHVPPSSFQVLEPGKNIICTNIALLSTILRKLC